MSRLRDLVAQGSNVTAPMLGFPGLQLVPCTIKTAQQNHKLHFEVIRALWARFEPDMMFPLMDLSLEANALGRETRFPVNEPASVTSANLSELEFQQMQGVDICADSRVVSYIKAIELMGQKLPAGVIKGAYVSGPFTLAGLLQGADQTAIDTLLAPQKLHELISFCTQTIRKLMEELQKKGAEVICILEPTASLLNPELFQEFSGDYIKELAGLCRENNGESILHICGNTMQFIDKMTESGVDGLSLDSVQAGVDIAGAAELIPEDMIIMGNICPTGKILTGTAAETRQEVVDLLRSMQKYKNFVLSTGCDLPQEVPLENIEAMFLR